jgi:hypothetical protein
VTISVITPAVAVKALQGVRRGYILHPEFFIFARASGPSFQRILAK